MNKFLGLSLLTVLGFVSSVAAFKCFGEVTVTKKDIRGHDYTEVVLLGKIIIGYDQGITNPTVSVYASSSQYVFPYKKTDATSKLIDLVRAGKTDDKLILCQAQFPNTTKAIKE